MKIKDLDIKKLCDKYRDGKRCEQCPLYTYPCFFEGYLKEEYGEVEIEEEDKESNE